MSFGLSAASYDVRIAQNVTIDPGEFVLASTMERFCIPGAPATKGRTTMTRNHLEAEVLFLNPDNVPPAVEALAAAGCKFEIDHGAVDPCGPTVFGWVTGTTELGENELGDCCSRLSTRSAAMSCSGALAGARKRHRRRDAAMKFPSQTD